MSDIRSEEERDAASERETAHLLKSEAMRRRILEAMNSKGPTYTLEEVCQLLGLELPEK